MKIKSIGKVMLLSSALLTSCERGPLRKIASGSMPKVELAVDSFAKMTQKALSDTALIKYASDTVELDKYRLLYDQREIIPSLYQKAYYKSPKTIIGTESNIISSSDIYASRYYDIKSVIRNEVFTNKRGGVFVPVEYYGKVDTRTDEQRLDKYLHP